MQTGKYFLLTIIQNSKLLLCKIVIKFENTCMALYANKIGEGAK